MLRYGPYNYFGVIGPQLNILNLSRIMMNINKIEWFLSGYYIQNHDR